MTWKFRNGMRVVCVDEFGFSAKGEPTHMEVCTVSNVFRVEGLLCLELVEYPTLETEEFWPGFDAKYFRPIDESKIDCLREHLTKVPKSVKEDA